MYQDGLVVVPAAGGIAESRSAYLSMTKELGTTDIVSIVT